MPTSMTYNSLFADLQTYLERGQSASADPTVFDQIPRLINAAERKLAQVFKLLGQIEVLRDAAGLQANQSVLTKPDRFRQTVSMHYGAGGNGNSLTPIFPRSYEYCRMFNPDSTVTGPPEFYAEYELNHWLIVPTPDITYPIELVVYMQPPLLDQANQTNFWTDLTPNALLYAALLESTPFLKDDPRIPTWQNYFAMELVSLGSQDLQRIMDRASERNRP